MGKLKIGDFNFEVIRSGRKTIAFEVKDDGSLIIRAPHRVTNLMLKSILEKERPVIEKKLQSIASCYAAKTKLSPLDGGRILYLGKEYRVKHDPNCTNPYFEDNLLNIPASDEETARLTIIAFLKSEAKRLFTERAEYYARRFGFHYTRLSVNSAVTRWGSCSAKNSLNFSYRLLFAPPEAVDYVVVHELSHTREHNHSARFWAVVVSVLPDYRERMQKLKELQRQYDIKSL